MFFESAIEASLTPMTAYFFHWEAKENSLCYVFMGICALLGYVAIMVLQKVKNLEDRTALLVGSIGVTVGLTLGFFGFPLGKYGDTWIFYVFGATVAISVFSLVNFTKKHRIYKHIIYFIKNIIFLILFYKFYFSHFYWFRQHLFYRKFRLKNRSLLYREFE